VVGVLREKSVFQREKYHPTLHLDLILSPVIDQRM